MVFLLANALGLTLVVKHDAKLVLHLLTHIVAEIFFKLVLLETADPS